MLEKRKPGRPKGTGKPYKDTSEKVVRIQLTIRPGQREKLDALGGSKWLRQKIDEA